MGSDAMINRTANQFVGKQCSGAVEIFWHEGKLRPLHGWYWRGVEEGARGPFCTSQEALLDAINNGHVYESGRTK